MAKSLQPKFIVTCPECHKVWSGLPEKCPMCRCDNVIATPQRVITYVPAKVTVAAIVAATKKVGA
jgi:hypothetical protein